MNGEERIKRAIAAEKHKIHLSTIIVLVLVVAGSLYYAYYYFQGQYTEQPYTEQVYIEQPSEQPYTEEPTPQPPGSQPASTEEVLMTDFIQQSLKEEFQPDSLEINQVILAGREVYQANWEHGTLELRVNLNYNTTENPNLIISLLHPNNIENLDGDIASGIASDYFNYNEGGWECLSGSTIKACEMTWFEGETKMSIGVSTNSALNSSLAYACKIVPGSEKYNQDMCTTIV